MKKQTYKVLGNKTAKDVIENNDQVLEMNLTLSEARNAAIQYQRDYGYVTAWVEAQEAAKAAPRRQPVITRSTVRDSFGCKVTRVQCDGWDI